MNSIILTGWQVQAIQEHGATQVRIPLLTSIHPTPGSILSVKTSEEMPDSDVTLFLRVEDIRESKLQYPFFNCESAVFVLKENGMELCEDCLDCIDAYGRPCCCELSDMPDEETGEEEYDGSECGLLDEMRSQFADLWDSTAAPGEEWRDDPVVTVIDFSVAKNPGMPASKLSLDT